MSLPTARRKARKLLTQALYQWQLSGTAITAVEAEFFTDHDMTRVDTEFFRELLHGIPANLDEVDGSFTPFLDRAADELDAISLALLRIGCYELLKRIDVPYKVVINESVSLAKTFAPTGAYKYINGILDKVAAKTRTLEVNAARA